MVIKRSHFYIGLAVIAVFFVVLVQQGALKLDSRAAKKDVRAVAIENCERGSERAALLAAFMRETGGIDGQKLADSVVATIPGSQNKSIADVNKVENERAHTYTFRLTDEARSLEKAGCTAVA